MQEDKLRTFYGAKSSTIDLWYSCRLFITNRLSRPEEEFKAAALRYLHNSFKFRLVFVSVLVSVLVNRRVTDNANCIYHDCLGQARRLTRSRTRKKMPRSFPRILRHYTIGVVHLSRTSRTPSNYSERLEM